MLVEEEEEEGDSVVARRLVNENELANLGGEPAARATYVDVVAELRDAVCSIVPAGATVLVISKGDEDLLRFDGRTGWHFPRGPAGDYAHYPADSEAAIRHLEDLRAKGAQYFAVPGTSFWWFDHYRDFGSHVETRYPLVHSLDGVFRLYALDDGKAGEGQREALRPAVLADLDDSPMLVFGAPRSGTTYLAHLLNEHPAVFITHETPVFGWMHEACAGADEVLGTSAEPFRRHLRERLPELVRDFYRRLAPSTARRWGDKNPAYSSRKNAGWLPTIAELFPHSQFVHIVRDGRDVVSSLVRKKHTDGRQWADFESAHRVWIRHVEAGCKFADELPSGRHFELRYEDLVSDDVGEARRLLEFLGLDLHERIREFCRLQRRERTPFSRPTRDLRGGATRSDWEEMFTPDQHLRSLELLGERLVRHGYETTSSLNEAVARLSRQAANARKTEGR